MPTVSVYRDVFHSLIGKSLSTFLLFVNLPNFCTGEDELEAICFKYGFEFDDVVSSTQRNFNFCKDYKRGNQGQRAWQNSRHLLSAIIPNYLQD